MSTRRFATIRNTFTNRDFAIYTMGNSISLLGFWVHRLATGWLAWELTGSGFWLGAVAFADLFPVIIVNPIAGVLADRVDRRRTMMACHTLSLIQAASLAVLVIMNIMTIEILFILTIVQGVVSAVQQPARLSFVPSLVRPADVSSALAINSVIFNIARFVGPAVAGVIITGFGVAPAFALHSATYVIILAALFVIRAPARQGMARDHEGIFAEMRDGLRYAFSHPVIGPILLLMIAMGMLARPTFELLPGFADIIFQRGAGGLAILTSAVGVGAIIGGIWLAQRGTTRGLPAIMYTGAAGMGAVVLVFILTDYFWIAVPTMALAGCCMTAFSTANQTLIQTTVDGHLRGRVLSTWGLILRSAPAFGALIMGWLSDLLGLRLPLAVGAGLCILIAAFAVMRRKRLIEALKD